MSFLGQNAYLASGALQLLAYLVLVVLSLVRIGRPWAVLALLGALASIVSTGWYYTANVSLRFSDDGLRGTEFFFAPAAQLVMQGLGVLGTVLLVAAVVVGRRTPPAPEPGGPTGTTFRQLPSGIRWE